MIGSHFHKNLSSYLSIFYHTFLFLMCAAAHNPREGMLQDSYLTIYMYLSLYLGLCASILQHPFAKIMCSCAHQKKKSVIEES